MTNTNNKYMFDVEQYGLTGKRIDREAFAADLAPLLNGRVRLDNADDLPGYRCPVIVLPDGLELYLSGHNTTAPDGVTFHAGSRELGRQAGDQSGIRFPSANVSTSRPIETIARDVRRRVVEPAAAPLAELRKRIAQQSDQAASLARHAAELSAAFPWLEIRTEPRATSAKVHSRHLGAVDNVYLQATLRADGSLLIDRIHSLDAATARRVLAALTVESDATTGKTVAVHVTEAEAMDLALAMQGLAEAGGEPADKRRQYENLAEMFVAAWSERQESGK